jgi:hypothetical protein
VVLGIVPARVCVCVRGCVRVPACARVCAWACECLHVDGGVGELARLPLLVLGLVVLPLPLGPLLLVVVLLLLLP